MSPSKLQLGITNNLKNRLQNHNAGKSTHTNKFKPWKIVWYCAFQDENKAKKFELYLKTASGIAFRNKRFI